MCALALAAAAAAAFKSPPIDQCYGAHALTLTIRLTVFDIFLKTRVPKS